jgi:hypothetical protein
MPLTVPSCRNEYSESLIVYWAVPYFYIYSANLVQQLTFSTVYLLITMSNLMKQCNNPAHTWSHNFKTHKREPRAHFLNSKSITQQQQLRVYPSVSEEGTNIITDRTLASPKFHSSAHNPR